ncbi:MAG TPA: L,D-transpeptidase family protein [Blastocatellia bacterium]|nr:L,D-transpeptidase family protein [Blastocatellia bacterium]
MSAKMIDTMNDRSSSSHSSCLTKVITQFHGSRAWPTTIGRALCSTLAIAMIAAYIPGLVYATGPAAEPNALTPALVSETEKRLFEMGYWTGAVDGTFDEQTRWGVLAFQRVTGRKQTGRLDPSEIEALQSSARPTPREKGSSHIEIDLTRQVLFVVDAEGVVKVVLPISSGNGKTFNAKGSVHRAVTPRGRFTVYNKIQGWRKSYLGMIYYPNYFNEGVAIHGSAEVPNYPASHGCIRIPMSAAKMISDMTPLGTVVIVYDDKKETAGQAASSKQQVASSK